MIPLEPVTQIIDSNPGSNKNILKGLIINNIDKLKKEMGGDGDDWGNVMRFNEIR